MDEPTTLLRRCIVTGDMLPKGALIRFVVDPRQVIVPDIGGTLPGKGIWVRCDFDSVHIAVQKKLFSKAAKKRVTTEETLAERVGILLKASCLNMLAMAKKSGTLVTGYTKVAALQEAGKAALVLRAKDSAFVMQAADKKAPLHNTDTEILLFDNDELSLALGRENVVHAALKPAIITEKCKILIKRYDQYI